MRAFKQNHSNSNKMSIDTVRDIISNRTAMTFSPTEEISKILEEMHKADIRAAGVVDRNDRLMGLISEREIVRRALGRSMYDFQGLSFDLTKLDRKLTAWDVMIANPVTVSPETDIDEALEIVKLHDFRYLPVREYPNRYMGVLDAREIYQCSLERTKRVLEQKDSFLSYLAGSETYGYGGAMNS